MNLQTYRVAYLVRSVPYRACLVRPFLKLNGVIPGTRGRTQRVEDGSRLLARNNPPVRFFQAVIDRVIVPRIKQNNPPRGHSRSTIDTFKHAFTPPEYTRL